MGSWIIGLVCVVLVASVGLGCGRDEKSSDERAAEVQRAIQAGAQKEQKMIEGMQKGMENLEKSLQEQKERSKN